MISFQEWLVREGIISSSASGGSPLSTNTSQPQDRRSLAEKIKGYFRRKGYEIGNEKAAELASEVTRYYQGRSNLSDDDIVNALRTIGYSS